MPASFSNLPAALENHGAETAIILGSGLNSFVDSLDVPVRIPYSDVPGLPVSKVPGHAGRFALAHFEGQPILVGQGRVHLYEGWTAREVSASIRLFHQIGIRRVLITNAAGTLNPDFPPGSWMMLKDHINLTGSSPLAGGANFVDMTTPYSEPLRASFRCAANDCGIPLFEGVYAALNGPQYETPAEIRMLRVLGADAVGMSTVPEVIQARALGLDVAAFSCLTNWAAGIGETELDHSEVTETGKLAAGKLVTILRTALRSMV